MELNLNLHPQQSLAFQSLATEILYGGAAGGGKSHLMRTAAITWCAEIPGLQVYLFRRVSDDLYKNHMIGPGGFFELLGDWIKAGYVTWNGSKNYIKFWNGSQIWLCHCQHEKDRFKYQGAEIHVLLIDELTHFTEMIYRYLRGRCRIGGLKIPAKYKGLFPRILSGSNPGGVGHTWVRRSLVNFAAPMKVQRADKKDGGMLRQFIPARLEDNPTLLENDPEYVDKLDGLGNPALVAAMKSGDWNIVAGGALDDVWDEEVLTLPRFQIPEDWRVDRSFDWGSTAPFSVGWWAEANGEEVEITDTDGTSRIFCPTKGSLIRIYEWYGSQAVGTNCGLKMGSTDVADGIRTIERHLLDEGWILNKPSPGPADNSIFSNDDKSTDDIASKMMKRGVRWIKSDKSPGSRKIGLQLLRDRLKASQTGEGPGIYFMENCRAVFELLPVLPRDEKNQEDVDTNAEDHNYDEIRYKCLSLSRRMPKNITARHST